MLNLQAITEKLPTSLMNRSINLHLFDSIDSTNRVLKELEPSDQIDICCAEKQTAGRGRFGRHWHSPYAENIYCSSRWPLEADMSRLSGLSLVVSLAILAALKRVGIHENIRVKWPNDIYWMNKKLCGSLIELIPSENKHANVIIGIGLNVNSITKKQTIPDLSWCSLYDITGAFMDRNLLISYLINELGLFLIQYMQHGFSHFIRTWNDVDYLQGQMIQVSSPSGLLKGKAQGVNFLGQLILVDGRGATHYLSAGDASLHI